MSRFHHFESSSSESSDNDDDVKVQDKPFIRPIDSSDSEDGKRVVKTGTEKKFDELRNISTALKNHKNNKDVTQMLNDFDQLIKCYEKSGKTIEIEKYHKYYTRVIVELEDFVGELWALKSKLSKNNNKSLAPLRQRVKKYNKEFAERVEQFRACPEDYPVDLVLDDEKAEKAAAIKKASVDEDGDEFDEDEDDLGMDDESTSSSSDDEEDKERYKMNPADRFLKSTVEKKKERKKDKIKERPVVAKKKDTFGDDNDEGWMNIEKHRRARLFAEGEEISVASLLEKMQSEMEARVGKKDQKRCQLELLESLLEIVRDKQLGIGLEVKLLTAKISNILQYTSSAKTPCLPVDKWTLAFEFFTEIVEILVNNVDKITVRMLNVDEPEILDGAPYLVNNCIVSLIDHIEIEYEKMLTHHDTSIDKDKDYILLLSHEKRLVTLCSKIHLYLDHKLDLYNTEDKCRFYFREVEHIYYRADPTLTDKLRELCTYIIKHDQTDRLRMRATLCMIYYIALQGDWFKARDIFAMSQIANCIEKADSATEILFNRVTVQMGLCAFKNGYIREAHQALAELQGSGRLKELLAQGVKMTPNITQEELHRDKAFLLPYHKHINTELIEGVYLVCAMITEVNNCYTQQPDGRRVIISRNFHHVLKNSDKLTLVGPPDNLKEHIVSASKALFNGDWRKATDYIFNPKMDRLLWKFFPVDAPIKDVVRDKIKVESLKAYLHGKASIFITIGLEYLASNFDLELSMVKQIVSKMIFSNKLAALIDEPMNCIRMTKTKSSSLHSNALKFSDKLAQLSDLNEKLVEAVRNK